MMAPKDKHQSETSVKTVAEMLAELGAPAENERTDVAPPMDQEETAERESDTQKHSAEPTSPTEGSSASQSATASAERPPQTVESVSPVGGSRASQRAAAPTERPPQTVEPTSPADVSPADVPIDSAAHPVVLVRDLTKRMGAVQALDGVNLALLEGHVLGLLGPNGSGKTTLLRILAGLAHPTSGRVEIDGMSPGIETKKIVSFLPDRQFLPDDMTVERARAFFSRFFLDFDQARFDELAERLKLPRKTKLSHLSKGFRDRLTVSLVMSRRARLYLLDEPLGGVDPVVREEVMDILIEAMGQEATLLITTHQVRDLERLFDEVCFLREGKIVRYGAAEVVRAEEGADLDTVYRRIYE